MTQERYFIGGDGSGHSFAVPCSRADEWFKWQSLPGDDPASWEAPDYAIRIDGRFTFTDPRAGGSAPSTESLSGDDRIKQMVNRFLMWKLPEDFNPDGGISFQKAINHSRPDWPQKNEPVGTNLFSADQAAHMVRYMVDGLIA